MHKTQQHTSMKACKGLHNEKDRVHTAGAAVLLHVHKYLLLQGVQQSCATSVSAHQNQHICWGCKRHEAAQCACICETPHQQNTLQWQYAIEKVTREHQKNHRVDTALMLRCQTHIQLLTAKRGWRKRSLHKPFVQAAKH